MTAEPHQRSSLVWITGASSGIGAALACALAERGARLVLSARRVKELEAVRQRCANPERHLVLPFDAADIDALPALCRRVINEVGLPDMLVLNAGIGQRSWARDTAVAVDQALMQINFLSPVALTKTLLDDMVTRGSGHIVVISSVQGKVGVPRRTGYAASKHALHGYFDSLRAELWPSPVRVSLVCPGYIDTGLPAAALTGDGSVQGKADAGRRKVTSPEVCARQILRGLDAGKDEFNVGGLETLVVPLARWWPWLYRRLVARASIP
ncbi:SDR family oxidoreductase [Chitinimonas sp. BJYL2]|uniref:SDR family oxidoreductase n=1 Tax=Chitinimonas sp. BJYL2 TaxID=2976696 RepID=UPI0022B3F6E9|nr:SDR family oxidoreductase [Chitinimonas sp. BJYL2]